ncbi:integrase arm-type DNA-binding domain-containing protein [Gammaproteobacteria bacterium]|nr:integrase arm-type DNA-binding domain-containing protein [Gammaproteobacteria bacterium]
MPRIAKPLTNTQIQHSKPKEKIYYLSDGEGLQLRITPTGSKSWLFNYYKPYSKKRTTMSFGTFPAVSLAQARTRRNDAKELLADNIDPKEHRDAEELIKQSAEQDTLERIAAQWLEVKRAKISADHASDTWRSLELHIFPALGRVPIHKINAKQTISVINPIAAQGILETVKRLCQRPTIF